MAKHIKKLKKRRRKAVPVVGANIALEQAIDQAGSQQKLADSLGIWQNAITNARRHGPSDGLALRVWEKTRISLSKLLGRHVVCPHCYKEL